MKIVDKWKASNPNYKDGLVIALCLAAGYCTSYALRHGAEAQAAKTVSAEPGVFVCFNGRGQLTTVMPAVTSLREIPTDHTWVLEVEDYGTIKYYQAFGEACKTELVSQKEVLGAVERRQTQEAEQQSDKPRWQL